MVKLIFLILTISNSYALTFKVYGPCDDAPLFSTKVNLEGSTTAGALSVKIFNENQIPYIGADSYMQSIFNSPFGLDAMEVLSDTHMRSHGFIYSVSGVVPETYPNEVYVTNDDEVIWYYGYVEYLEGEWGVDYLYTNKIKPAQFCN